PMIHRAFEAGVNYIDTAVGYCNQDSQRAVGDALKGWREKVVLSTKNPYYGPDEGEWRRNLENSLERLQVQYLDIYNHHGISWQRYVDDVEPRVSKWMVKARDEGLVKHICCSFHDTNEALMKLVDTGYPEVITLQYNMLDRQLEEGIAYAREKGIGIVVMGPVGGGRLGATSAVLESLIPGIGRVPELALRFVLSNPNVSLALSGMSTLTQVEENVQTAADPISLSAEDTAAIDEQLTRLKKMSDLYCSGCAYCQPCPQEVNIPAIFGLYNMARVYGLWDLGRERYAQLGKVEWMKGKQADACVECGACEEKCPQHLSIREQLAEVHQALTGKA
ncbi:MAG TPA: aldo/keto reductase, partial [Armatimonadota bacterium]|nr:aldo/keto reductase [Armatimonadota bacterium]